MALVLMSADPGSEGRRPPKKTTSTSTRQFDRTPIVRACGVGRRGGMLGSTDVAVLVAATMELEGSATRTSLITLVVLIGPDCSVVVVPVHRYHWSEKRVNSAWACAAEGSETTPSMTLITCAGSPLFHHDSDATSLTSADW